MSSGQHLGLIVMIAIGAIIAGYIVYTLTPSKHYPSLAGLLAANAIVGGLAVAGVGAAADMLGAFIFFTVVVWVVALVSR
jgi:hypothetical protein